MTPIPQIPEGFVPDLIAVDVDDTLVQHLGGVTERVVRSIERVREAGVAVAIATGRTPSTTIPVARAAGIDDLIVCSNGALLVSVETEATIEYVTFDPRPVLEELREHLPHAVYAVEDVHGMFRTTKMFPTGPLAMSIREVPFEHLLEEPIVRLVVRSEAHTDGGFGPIVEKLGYQSVIYGIAEVAWLDVGPKGVNKATMLQRLCERRGYDPAKTITIGDSWNDTAMLEWAGVGVAMDTAPDQVKAYADTITSGVPGDGVADVLDALQF
ncbi:MAG: HAD family phosphatase [Actinobacteria bacterium]|nr:HAD family phosphatase [Actinomycetota bacterium]